jgi:hypothetical protein
MTRVILPAAERLSARWSMDFVTESRPREYVKKTGRTLLETTIVLDLPSASLRVHFLGEATIRFGVHFAEAIRALDKAK